MSFGDRSQPLATVTWNGRRPVFTPTSPDAALTLKNNFEAVGFLVMYGFPPPDQQPGKRPDLAIISLTLDRPQEIPQGVTIPSGAFFMADLERLMEPFNIMPKHYMSQQTLLAGMSAERRQQLLENVGIQPPSGQGKSGRQ